MPIYEYKCQSCGGEERCEKPPCSSEGHCHRN